MDLNTLTLYLVAGAISGGLCVVLLVGAHLHPGTRILKSFALAIAMMAVGLVVSGIGPSLPRWMTVMGTNMLLLSAGTVFYAGVLAYLHKRPPSFDRVGWSIVALTAIPFWYWGLVEPDGHFRSAVYSLAVAAINGRTAVLLSRLSIQRMRSLPVWALTALFGIVTVWMAIRGVVSLLAATPPSVQRGANPTSWITVFWYIVLVSSMSICVFWIEFTHVNTRRPSGDWGRGTAFSWVRYFSNRLLLLWSMVTILLIGIAGETALIVAKSFEWERTRLTRSAESANEAFVHHSRQVVSQADTLLQAVRGFYLRTASVSDTEAFINALPFDRTIIGNIYLTDAQGLFLIAHDALVPGRSVADRDYFRFHSNHAEDAIFIGPVEVGRITGRPDFRVTRPIVATQGGFAGVVVATVSPQALSGYWELAQGSQNTASLIGMLDHKLRARTPSPPAENWQNQIESPLWKALEQSDTGTYANDSMIDGVRRTITYKKVGDLPLVMVTGFSDVDVFASVRERVQWAVFGVALAAGTMLVLATLLTMEIRRRNEQDNFLSMLSHELKTPLSVLRLALGSEGNLSPTTRKHAQRSIQDMDTIIYRCLQVDRLQHRGHKSVVQACQVSELLSALRTGSSYPDRLQIEARDLPTVQIDPQLLSIALNNLVDNALKYATPRSMVRISANPQAHKRRDGILMYVSNTAGSAGLPDPGKVFKKYYRGAKAHSMTGSGLGLYLVHTVARLLGGWVRYAPAADEVRFELWVPLERAPGRWM